MCGNILKKSIIYFPFGFKPYLQPPRFLLLLPKHRKKLLHLHQQL
jgi:hypothetical protein